MILSVAEYVKVHPFSPLYLFSFFQFSSFFPLILVIVQCLLAACHPHLITTSSIKKFYSRRSFFLVPGDEKTPSPAGGMKTESSLPFDRFSPLENDLGDGQGDQPMKSLSQQLPDYGTPSEEVLSSPSEMPKPPPPESTALSSPSVKPDPDASVAMSYGLVSSDQDSAALAQGQRIVKDAAPSLVVEPKIEDMEESSRQNTPTPSQLNPGAGQDEESQLSFNQDNQSSDTSLFSVRWPKVSGAGN